MPRMRWTIRIGAVLVIVLAAYTAWPLAALYRLARAIEARDKAALGETIDLALLRRSLTTQIVAEYLKLTGTAQKLGPLATSLAAGVGATVADSVVARLLNLDTLIDILNKGSVGAAVAGMSFPAEAPINAGSLASTWRTWLNSEYSGTRFVVSLPPDQAPAQQFRVTLNLIRWQWKLTGIELPEPLRMQLAQEALRTNPKP
jgi:hypothetical protein